MRTPSRVQSDAYQEHFHQHWNFLNDPHVRTLAWLLDAPDLLDAGAPDWHGRIASIDNVDEPVRAWLRELDQAPQQLHASLGLQPFTRLGRYAERLIAFYLEHRGELYAHGVQVRSAKNETIGEFDFLLKRGEALVHWEFATKLYLLESSGHGRHADYFVGPNLADTLGAKVRKIMDQQLTLSQHPAAREQLSLPVTAAQALVKGWLFYHGETPVTERPPGISYGHCRGFWCTLEEATGLDAECYALLPRLSWLAPAKIWQGEGMGHGALMEELERHFAASTAPALVAMLRSDGNALLEGDRGFIVPNDWRSRAESRIKRLA